VIRQTGRAGIRQTGRPVIRQTGRAGMFAISMALLYLIYDKLIVR